MGGLCKGKTVKEVLLLTKLGEMMKKRFALIQHWLQAAEKNYQADQKAEGELNLLLAQAEARRALELSCQQEKTSQPKKKVTFYWKAGTVLVVFVLALGLYHYNTLTVALPEKSQLKEKISISPIIKPQESLAKEKIVEQVSSSPSTNLPVKPVHTSAVKKEVSREPSKENGVKKEQKPTDIQVDMLGLVQEAQKTLYQESNTHPEKEAIQ